MLDIESIFASDLARQFVFDWHKHLLFGLVECLLKMLGWIALPETLVGSVIDLDLKHIIVDWRTSGTYLGREI